jgi:hypothetical protein
LEDIQGRPSFYYDSDFLRKRRLVDAKSLILPSRNLIISHARPLLDPTKPLTILIGKPAAAIQCREIIVRSQNTAVVARGSRDGDDRKQNA